MAQLSLNMVADSALEFLKTASLIQIVTIINFTVKLFPPLALNGMDRKRKFPTHVFKQVDFFI